MSKITVQTQVAPFWRHLFAMFYDIFLLLACIMVVGFVFIGLNKGEIVVKNSALWHGMRGAILLTWIGFFVYFWSSQGQTLGMRAWRLIIVDNDRQVPGIWRALWRWFLALLTCLPVGLGFWWQLLDTDKRTLYDRLSRTSLYLVDKNPYRE